MAEEIREETAGTSVEERIMETRSRALVGSGLLLLLGVLPLAAQRAGAPALGVDGLVLFRGEGSLAVLAKATPYWQEVFTPSEALLGDFQYLPEYASARAQGQVFEVLATDAPGWMGGSGSRFVAVPWGFGPGCAEEGWPTPEWVAPGDTVAFLLIQTRVRPRDGERLPVFDVLGWHQPYPVGDLIPFWRKGLEVNPRWLTPVEFYHLLRVLPTELGFLHDPEAALDPARTWLQGAPGRKDAFPVPEILTEWERRRREVGAGGRAPRAGTLP